jgi:hypothetical protein
MKKKKKHHKKKNAHPLVNKQFHSIKLPPNTRLEKFSKVFASVNWFFLLKKTFGPNFDTFKN